MLNVVDLSGNGKGIGLVGRTVVSTNLEALGRTPSARIQGNFNHSLDGTFIATLQLEKSYDNGLTWNPITAGGSVTTYTTPVEELYSEPEFGTLYCWNCTAYTSGIIIARISQ